MTAHRERRLQRIRDALRSIPIQPEAVAAAFERFRANGELPTEVPLAIEVERRVRAGFDVHAYAYRGPEGFAQMVRQTMHLPPRPADPVIDRLLVEAIYGQPLIRMAARCALRGLAQTGFDVTSSPFVDHADLVPEFGSVGIAFCGVPLCFATGAHEDKAPRLERQLAELRARAPAGDRPWFEAAARGAEDFADTGKLPADPLLRDAALLLAEIHVLMTRVGGEAVEEVLAAFEELANAGGDARDERLVELQRVIRARGPAA